MNVELKPIAESKVRQLGGDVCGVLVRKGDQLAAVDEHGRVQWLQDGQGAEPVGYTNYAQIGYVAEGDDGLFYPDTDHGCDIALYTHPQPAQQGVPDELREKALELCRAVENEEEFPPAKFALRCLMLVNQVRKLAATPQQGSVPEWMTEVSENLATQDNRITQDPLFVVFQKREIVAHEDYDHDRISWGNCEGEADDEVQDWLNDAREDVDGDHYLDDEIEFHDEDSGTETFRRVALKETDEFVTACFTEAGAKDYLKANGHNLTRPHIYVTSLYRNEEMNRLRDWLMSQPPQEGSGDE